MLEDSAPLLDGDVAAMVETVVAEPTQLDADVEVAPTVVVNDSEEGNESASGGGVARATAVARSRVLAKLRRPKLVLRVLAKMQRPKLVQRVLAKVQRPKLVQRPKEAKLEKVKAKVAKTVEVALRQCWLPAVRLQLLQLNFLVLQNLLEVLPSLQPKDFLKLSSLQPKDFLKLSLLQLKDFLKLNFLQLKDFLKLKDFLSHKSVASVARLAALTTWCQRSEANSCAPHATPRGEFCTEASRWTKWQCLARTTLRNSSRV